jgi:hypothetical protein
MMFNVASVAGLLTSGVVAMTIWLLLAQPLSVANAVNTGDLSALVHALAAAIGDALAAVLQYL